MKWCLSFLVFFISLSVYPQQNFSILNGRAYDKTETYPSIDSFHKKFKYLITFQTVSNWFGAPSINFLLLKRGGHLFAYKGNDYTYSQCAKLNISQDSLIALWNGLVANNLFILKTDNELTHNCPTNIFDCGAYKFVLIHKSKMKTLYYACPELYMKYCDDIDERKNITACALLIMKVTGKL